MNGLSRSVIGIRTLLPHIHEMLFVFCMQKCVCHVCIEHTNTVLNCELYYTIPLVYGALKSLRTDSSMDKSTQSLHIHIICTTHKMQPLCLNILIEFSLPNAYHGVQPLNWTLIRCKDICESYELWQPFRQVPQIVFSTWWWWTCTYVARTMRLKVWIPTFCQR